MAGRAVQRPPTGSRVFGNLIGGRPCLDFVNTVGGRVSRPGRARKRDYRDHVLIERLGSYDALVAWAELAGLFSAKEGGWLRDAAARHPNLAGAVLARALELREAIYRILRASQQGWHPDADDLAVLNRELRGARLHERLGGVPPLVWEWEGSDSDLDQVLWPVLRDAAELLTSDALSRLGQCAGHECGWLFLDTSRGHRRRWCDMADCGNRAKVRRFRQRRGSKSMQGATRQS